MSIAPMAAPLPLDPARHAAGARDVPTNVALAAAGYTTAPSPSYGLKLILRDGEPVGHFDCLTAWDLPGVREAAAELASVRADLEALIPA